MVFHSISGKTRNNSTKTVMASSSTLKSQPLHNFQLHDLKWAMNNNHTNDNHHHRLRKFSDSSHNSPQRGDKTDSDSDNTRKGNQVFEAPLKNGGASSGSSHEKSVKEVIINGSDNSDKKATPSDGRSKIYIRLRTKNQKPVNEFVDVGDQNLNVEDVEELVPKTWNLRPRKPISKPHNHNGGVPKTIGALAHENKADRPESIRSRNVNEPKATEKKEKKQKFSISLTREEIDDDIYAMTGSKASRRPKKRAKNVQKQLDCVFPGMWLASITPDCYRVSEAPLKG